MTSLLTLRFNLGLVAMVTILLTWTPVSSRKLVFFHNSIPSNLYVNAAHGPTHIKDDPDGKTEIIRLLLYPTDKSRAPKTARAVVNSGVIYGLVTFRQDNPPTGPTFIAGVMKRLPPGPHSLKIFEYGDIESNCSAVGAVYSPYNMGLMMSEHRDIGELGMIMADGSGTAEFAMSDPFVSLVGPRSIIGRAVVVTEMEKNASKGSDIEKRGCGVIGYAR